MGMMFMSLNLRVVSLRCGQKLNPLVQLGSPKGCGL